MEAAIGPRTRAIFLAAPNNPAGAVYTRDELSAIAALCRSHDLWLVSDEVYGSLSMWSEPRKPLQEWVESVTSEEMDHEAKSVTEEQIIGILREQEAGVATAAANTGSRAQRSTNGRPSTVAWRYPMPSG